MHAPQHPYREPFSVLAENLAVTLFHGQADEDWTLDYLSQGYYELTGKQQWSASSDRAPCYATFLARVEAEQVCAQAYRALQAHHTFTMQYDIITTHGRKRVLERTRGLYDEHEHLKAIVGMVVDLEDLISGEPLLGEPRSFLEPLLQHAPFPVYMVSADDHMRIANPAFESFAAQGRPCERLKLGELFSPAAATTFHEQNQRVLETRAPLTLTEPVPGPTRMHYFHTVKFPVWDALERRYAVGGVSMDITSLVETAEALENSRQGLREALSLREDFITIAAHELRTPLTSLFLRLRQLRKQLDSRDSPLPAATLEPLLSTLCACEEQSRRLSRLVDQLLDTGRIRGGRLELRPSMFELGELVRAVVTRHEVELNRAGCHVSLEQPHPVWGEWDAARLEQVVTNLLTNALKYGAGQPISISLEYDTSAQRARLRVKDQGIGIAPELQQRIFERFERAVPTHSYGGLGLGLYICREILRAHGGSIRVESTPGEGAEFLVDLPLTVPIIEGERVMS
jgi:signal transduction histidine kinase